MNRFPPPMRERLAPVLQSLKRWAPLLLLASTLPARGQFSLPEDRMVHSVSGQFLAVAPEPPSRFTRLPQVLTNNDYVRLDAALLTVSAERVKESLRHELHDDSAWCGRIYLVVRPARSLDDDVMIVSKKVGNVWSYQMQLPDVITQSRFLRALTGTLLMETANRANPSTRSPEIPDWLIDGLARDLAAQDVNGLTLSPPEKVLHGMPLTRTDAARRGLDPLQHTRAVLRNTPALTFQQLSWPNEAQLRGNDDGVYVASAQLFVHQLQELKDGDEKLREMIRLLPQYYNWQTAFEKAFAQNFKNALAVEKWWALQMVSFAAQQPGTLWTVPVSREKLDEILQVPVAVRASSNALPARAEISLQVLVRNFAPDQQAAILQTKLRDLEWAQLRLATPIAQLGGAYRAAIADYLGEGKPGFFSRFNRHPKPPRKSTAADMLKRLDALDAQRRKVAAEIDAPSPANSVLRLEQR
ncbi:MAG TPA: hypothetical protein VFV81_09115 [Verrucomicrobiae bacterium]|nr:hypothetical protein [Verrucomicrobiae bacterium]